MNRVLLALLPVALFAGQPRYARLGEFDGNVEVQLHPADPWSPAERNLTLRELAWLRSGPSSRLEIELDEGSAWRIGPDSQMEISDYSLLSSGQRLTVVWRISQGSRSGSTRSWWWRRAFRSRWFAGRACDWRPALPRAVYRSSKAWFG